MACCVDNHRLQGNPTYSTFNMRRLPIFLCTILTPQTVKSVKSFPWSSYIDWHSCCGVLKYKYIYISGCHRHNASPIAPCSVAAQWTCTIIPQSKAWCMTKWTPSTAVLIFSWPTRFPAFSCRQMVSHQCPPGYCAKGLCQIRRNRDEVVVEAQKYRSSHSMRRVYLEISYKRQVNKSTQITWQSHGNHTAAAQCVWTRRGGNVDLLKSKTRVMMGKNFDVVFGVIVSQSANLVFSLWHGHV